MKPTKQQTEFFISILEGLVKWLYVLLYPRLRNPVEAFVAYNGHTAIFEEEELSNNFWDFWASQKLSAYYRRYQGYFNKTSLSF